MLKPSNILKSNCKKTINVSSLPFPEYNNRYHMYYIVLSIKYSIHPICLNLSSTHIIPHYVRSNTIRSLSRTRTITDWKWIHSKANQKLPYKYIGTFYITILRFLADLFLVHATKHLYTYHNYALLSVRLKN